VDVTIKHRLGVDEHDTWEQLLHFIKVVSAPPASVRHFVVHARKAILGLSTADNREVNIQPII
jgi:tRNA-dihydrouridine synthase A